ncbi:MAG: pilus assembly protein PilM [bacterium]
MSKNILIIDLGKKTLKLAELQKKEAGWQILKTARIDLESKEPLAMAGQLSRVLKEHKIRAKQVIVAISAGDIAYQLIELPPMPKTEVHAAIKFKLEAGLSFPVNEAVYDQTALTHLATKDKHIYFSSAVPSSFISAIKTTIQKAGLHLLKIIPAACSLRAALPSNQGLAAMVQASEGVIIIAVVKDNQLVFAREVDIDLETVATEIQRTFDYYKDMSNDQEVIQQIIVSGEGAMVGQLADSIKTSLGLETNIYQSTVLGDVKDTTGLAIIIGTALAGDNCLDFIGQQQQQGLGKILTENKTVLTAVGSYLLILILALAFYLGQNLMINKQLAVVKQAVEKLDAQISLLSQNDQSILQMINEIGAKPGETDRFVNIMSLLQDKTPADIYFEKIDYLKATNSLSLKGIVIKYQANKMVTGFIEQLKASPLINMVTLSYLVESDRFATETFEFEIICNLGSN